MIFALPAGGERLAVVLEEPVAEEVVVHHAPARDAAAGGDDDGRKGVGHFRRDIIAPNAGGLRPAPLPSARLRHFASADGRRMGLFAATVQRISDHPVLFIFLRSILENDFKAIRAVIRRELRRAARGCARSTSAAGPGAFADLFAGDDYVGVDLNARYIDHARKTRKGAFIVSDARHVDLPDGRFDQILIFGLLHHLSDDDVRAVLAECRRLLVPGRAHAGHRGHPRHLAPEPHRPPDPPGRERRAHPARRGVPAAVRGGGDASSRAKSCRAGSATTTPPSWCNESALMRGGGRRRGRRRPDVAPRPGARRRGRLRPGLAARWARPALIDFGPNDVGYSPGFREDWERDGLTRFRWTGTHATVAPARRRVRARACGCARACDAILLSQLKLQSTRRRPDRSRFDDPGRPACRLSHDRRCRCRLDGRAPVRAHHRVVVGEPAPAGRRPRLAGARARGDGARFALTTAHAARGSRSSSRPRFAAPAAAGASARVGRRARARSCSSLAIAGHRVGRHRRRAHRRRGRAGLRRGRRAGRGARRAIGAGCAARAASVDSPRVAGALALVVAASRSPCASCSSSTRSSTTPT